MAVYSGDGNYGTASDGTIHPGVLHRQHLHPAVATTPANPSIILGGSNTDGATVTGVGGVTPTGTVTFYVCGPFTSDHRLHDGRHQAGHRRP